MSGLFFVPAPLRIRVSKATLLPPVNPTTQQQSEQTGRKEDCSGETRCTHTQSNRLPAPLWGFSPILDGLLVGGGRKGGFLFYFKQRRHKISAKLQT